MRQQFYMARRTCPNCNKVVEILVEHSNSKVIKKCPNCGYIFIEYEVKRSLFPPSTESHWKEKENYRFYKENKKR